jgi:hypothetical protein
VEPVAVCGISQAQSLPKFEYELQSIYRQPFAHYRLEINTKVDWFLVIWLVTKRGLNVITSTFYSTSGPNALLKKSSNAYIKICNLLLWLRCTLKDEVQRDFQQMMIN